MIRRNLMVHSGLRFFACALATLSLCLVSTVAYAQSREQARQTFLALPQSFEPNRGQTSRGVDFISHGPGYTLSLTPNEADLQLVGPETSAPNQGQMRTLRMRLLGANAHAPSEGREIQAGRSNYFIGNNSSLWRTDIPQYGRVEYREVYPGTDLAYYGNRQQLEYDFVLGPHADPRRIRLAIEGADRIHIDETGDLVLTVGSAEVRQKKPTVYQDTPGGRRRIEGRYVVRGRNRVGFEVAAYDRRKPLVVDPVLVFSTYFGGNGDDLGASIRLDSAGNIYFGGKTSSTNFPSTPVPGTPSGQPLNGSGTAAYVAKINSSGTLVYSSYIGGTNDFANASDTAVDSNGNVYLVGNTSAADFPVLNPIQSTYHGNVDGFVLELNSSGNALVYSTYLGGSSLDYVHSIEVDANAVAYVTGSTASTDFPTLNAEQSTYGGGTIDSFAAKISAGGAALVYSTYIGGSGTDFNNGLTIDTSGNLYAFGDTGSMNFPVSNAFQSSSGGGTDGWLTKLDPAGNLLYSTYIGGSGGDTVRGAKIDGNGNIHLAGSTTSTNFPTLNAIQPNYAGGANDAFVASLNPAGSALIYSTYLGGSSDDQAWDLQLDAVGNVYIAGFTSSTDFPTVNAIQKSNAGGAYDVFLTKINAAGSALVFSTYLGGSGSDSARQMVVDAGDRAYVVGTTSSSNFPTVNPLQGVFGGGPEDAFIAIISTCDFAFSPPSAQFASTGGSGSVSITTTPECGWTATTNYSWITITPPASGQGSGAVSYTVAPNNGGTQLNGNITIGDVPFSIAEFGTAVTLTSINPANGAQGTNVPVTLTGTNFAGNSTVNVSGSAIAVSNVAVVNPTQITATFQIAANAATGGYTVTVTSGGQNSNGVTFTVISIVPVLSSLSPASGGAGNSVPVTLTGANFLAGATLSSTNSGLSFSNVNVVSSTQITATFTVAANATLGSAPVTVTTANGTSNAVGFTIQAQFTAIRVDAGSSKPYTDPLGQLWSADNGFTGGSLVSINHAVNGTPAPALYQTVHAGASTFTYQTAVPNGSYTVNLKFQENFYTQSGKRLFNVVVNGSTVLTNFDIFAAAGAQYQALDVPIPVTVTTGQISIQFVPVVSAPGVFAIEIVAGTLAAPTVTAITPNTGTIGSAAPVTITGTNLASDVVINAGPYVTVNNITVVSATQVNATFNISASAPPGQANVTVTTPGGTTAPSPFTIGNAPTLTSISPNNGTQGTNVPVTLTGTNFAANSTVNVSGSGITVSNVAVVNPTQITATFQIAANAPTGGYTVTVTSAGMNSNGVTFTVNSAGPTVTSISPTSGVQGTNVPVTLTGTNFAANATVNVSDSAVTVSNVVVVSATQVTATFAIASNANVGGDTVTVASGGQNSNGVTFTVNSAGPTLTSISPTNGVQGTNVPVTLTGTNFAANATVNVSDSAVTVSNVVVVSATQITATFAIASNANVGGDTVTVTSGGQNSNGVTFTVNPAAPTLSSISPNNGTQGTNVPVTLTGTNFAGNSTVNVSGSGITVSNVAVVNPTQITATFQIAANAATGGYTVTVTSGGQNSNGVTLTVNAAAPTLSSISPNNGTQGTNVPVTLTGTNFAANSTVNVSGSGITVSNVVVVNATQITATFQIAANAATGGYTVTVTSGGQNSNGVTFTVVPPPPLLNSLSPASGGAGNSVPVTLTGANFLAGATLSSTNSGLSFSNVNVVSSTQITATFTVAANATLGSAPVTVTTANGTSNAVGFTIQAQFTPLRVDAGSSKPYTDPLGQLWSADNGFTGGSLVSINHAVNGTPAPALYQTVHAGASTFTYQTAVPNGSYTVNLKFQENFYTQSGKRLFNVVINGSTMLTNFDIFAAAGAQYQAIDVPIPVTVTTGQISIQFVPVVSAPGVFAIEIVAGTLAAPTVTAITPNTGTIGSAVPVTITGTNLASDVVINAGPYVTVNNITVVSATQVNATFNISASAPPGQANVTVTTPGGTTAPSPFTLSH